MPPPSGVNVLLPMPKRVLIVDDSMDMRLLLRVYLERRGVEVVGEAESLADGARVAGETQPDGVVADVHLTDTEDVDRIIGELREAAPDALIIALSAAPPPKGARAAVVESTGAFAYLDKGDGIGRLAEQVADLLEDRSSTS
jgi:DNA-binding NtrC family response regulator